MVAGGPAFDRYEILGTLGRGGFAVVYHVRDRSLGREVALKSLLSHLAEDPDVHSRFLGEARAIARLTHPNIITIHDVNEAEGRPFYTMELIHGRALATLLGGGPMELNQVTELMQPLASAIDYLHAAGIIHRDIKPANVMLDTRGRVVLMDFGIARVLDQTQYTRTSMTLGTPAYMAPEQIAGGPIGPPADIYSLGIIAYEMLAGRPPFEGTTAQLLYAQVNLPHPPLSAFRRDLPAAALATIDAALAKEPGRRPASAAQFAAALPASPHHAAARPLPPTVDVSAPTRTQVKPTIPPSAAAATLPWMSPRQPTPLTEGGSTIRRRAFIAAAGAAGIAAIGGVAIVGTLASRGRTVNNLASRAGSGDSSKGTVALSTTPATNTSPIPTAGLAIATITVSDVTPLAATSVAPPTTARTPTASVPLAYSEDLARWQWNDVIPNLRDLSVEPPEPNWNVAPLLGRQRLYGILKLKPSTNIRVVIDVLDDKESQMVFTFDDHTDFTNQTRYTTVHSQLRDPVRFTVQYPSINIQNYAMTATYLPSFHTSTGASVINPFPVFVRTGYVDINGKTFSIALKDTYFTGSFDNLRLTHLKIDAADGMTPYPSDSQAANLAFTVAGTKYAISSIAEDGTSANISQV